MVQLYGKTWTRADLTRYVADMDQIGGIRPVAFQDGPEAGVRALEVRTGAGLAFTILADRAMDVGLAEIDGVPLSFLTGVGYVHPTYYSASGQDWLRTFPGGLFVTGGLDTFGQPSRDAGSDFGLHGRATALPACGLAWDADWEGDEYVLRARGRMKQVSMHGEQLQLTRQITARLGENRFAVHDVVENLAGRPEPHMMLYHFNVGFPLLDDGTELEVRASRTVGLDERSRAVESTAHTAHGPVYGFEEEVLVHDVEPDADGWITARVVNTAFGGGRGLALAIRYRKDELPYLWQWRNLRERAYVMGVEPGNADMRGRAYNREHGTLPVLEPGERREYHLEVAALLGPR
ncbi:MAG: aldose 1-epimerase family protein [Chloroflexi bacterium]|nr:aldose 1-epimerase family protein [Chloroflexota bacterium]